MDTRVVLDANAYVETNYGRSGKFSSLLDFLKKTNSRLVLLPSVLEEVLAKHERDFRSHVDAAKSSVRVAAGSCFTAKLPVLLNGDPDFSKERDALRQSMLGVGKMTVEYLEECSGVSVLDVAKRGARRIPPASPNGEELRDVIHWLTILSYANRSDSRILFVTRDSGFWTKDGGPREEILKDVKDIGGKIELFRDIEDLLRQNALSSAPLDSNRATALFDISQVETPIVERVGSILDRVELEDSTVEFDSGHLTSSEFQSGIVYQVSGGSEFVEGTFRVNIATQIEFKPKTWPRSSLVGGLLGGKSVPLSGLSGIRQAPVSYEAIVLVDLSTRVIDGQVGTAEVERVRWETKG
jgi:PIN domain